MAIYRYRIEAVWYEDVEAESEEEAYDNLTFDVFDNYGHDCELEEVIEED